MEKLTAILVILSCFGVSTISCQELDCSSKFTCNPLKPWAFSFRGSEIQCNTDTNLAKRCNLYPTKCEPCIENENLCDKFFTCDNTDPSKVIVPGVTEDIHCPTSYECNSKGLDDQCLVCNKKKCSSKNWICVDESHAIYKGQKVECADDSVCNKDFVEPCDQPCIPKNPVAQNYIRYLTNLCKSESRR